MNDELEILVPKGVLGMSINKTRYFGFYCKIYTNFCVCAIRAEKMEIDSPAGGLAEAVPATNKRRKLNDSDAQNQAKFLYQIFFD